MSRKRRIVMTNRDLRKQFDIFNKKFFDSAISNQYKVEFRNKMEDSGVELSETREIFINSTLRYFPDFATVILLHEMAHASLPEYIGYEHDDAHGMRFQAKLVELFIKGAYDGLL